MKYACGKIDQNQNYPMNVEIDNFSLAGRRAIAQQDWPTVHICANGILARQADHPEGLFLLGLVEKAAGHPRKATEAFEAVLRVGTPTQPHGAVGMFSSWGTCAWVPPTVMLAEVIDLFVTETTSTLGALYYFGAMKALDQYPGTGGEGHALVEQYQIFGD